jgi:hypothetical protein
VKKYCIFYSLCFIAALPVYGQVTFQKRFYPDYPNGFGSGIQTAENGFVVTGLYNASVNSPAFLIKMNAAGDTLWTKSFFSNFSGSDVIQTKDGGYFIAGSTMIKTDSSGNLLWSKAIAGFNTDHSNSVIETAAGEIVIAGQSKLTNPTNYQFVLIKSDSAGNQIFGKRFGESTAESANKIALTNDGGYIIAGETASYPVASDGVLIKTDSAGNITWARTYGGIHYDGFNTVKQTSDGGYLALGLTRINTIYYLLVVKTDSTGNLSWSKTYKYGSSSWGYSLCETNDGNFILAGGCASSGGASLLIKIDSNGAVIWARMFDPDVSNETAFKTIVPTSDSGFALYGYNLSALLGSKPFFYMIKTDSSCNSDCFIPVLNLIDSVNPIATSVKLYSPTSVNIGNSTVIEECFCDSMSSNCNSVGINENPAPSSMEVYPDPFSDKLNIKTKRNELDEVKFYDVLGRNISKQSFTNSTTINTELFAKGIYLYEVRNKNGVIKKGKVVKD